MDLPTVQMLRCLVALGDHKHFGRAANAMLMTQPPLSRQIQLLERTVGARLLIRSSQGVIEWTPAGDRLLEDARRILALLEATTDATRRIGEGRGGRVRIGFIPAAALSVVAGFVRELNDKLAELELVLTEMSMPDQMATLLRGQLDLALTWQPPRGNNIASQVILTERLMVLAPKDHHLVHTEPVAVAELLSESLIMYDARQSLYLHDLGTQVLGEPWPSPAATVHHLASAVALVSAHIGLALVPESVKRTLPNDLVLLPLADRNPQVDYHACWHNQTYNPVLIALLDYLRERFTWPNRRG